MLARPLWRWPSSCRCLSRCASGSSTSVACSTRRSSSLQAAREGVRLAALAGGSGYSAADVSTRVAQAAPNPGFGGSGATVSTAPTMCSTSSGRDRRRHRERDVPVHGDFVPRWRRDAAAEGGHAMRWMTRRRRDRGAAALIVTMLFSSGVCIGCAALTVDVGQLYSERRQLQNGADAAALSLAKVCASAGTCSYAGADAVALGGSRISTLNNANAKDNYAAFNATFNAAYDNGLCGRATTLPNCVAPNGSLARLPSAAVLAHRRTGRSPTSRCTTSPRPTARETTSCRRPSAKR